MYLSMKIDVVLFFNSNLTFSKKNSLKSAITLPMLQSYCIIISICFEEYSLKNIIYKKIFSISVPRTTGQKFIYLLYYPCIYSYYIILKTKKELLIFLSERILRKCLDFISISRQIIKFNSIFLIQSCLFQSFVSMQYITSYSMFVLSQQTRELRP